MKKKNFFWMTLLFLPLVAFSQEEAAFVIEFDNTPVSEVLTFIEEKFEVRFSYKDELVADKRISIPEQEWTLKELLDIIGPASQIGFQRIDERYIFVSGSSAGSPQFLVLDHVIVKGYLTSGITKTKEGTFNIKPKELNVLPGLIEADVLESIQQLPSVISPNETASGFIVRGGRADQNRIIWDGINMYHKGHLFGMISAFNPNSIENVRFSHKGTHPRYGERISSVIDISSEENVADRIEAGIGLNGLSADGYVDIPLIPDKLSIHAAARRSYNEVYETFTFDKLADKVFQTTKITNAENTNNEFFFLDYNLKLNYHPNDRTSFHFSTIQIDNTLDYLVQDIMQGQSFNDILSIKNEGYSARWKYRWSENVSQETLAYASKYRFRYNFVANDSVQQVSNFEKRNIISDSGITSEVTITTRNKDFLSFGYQYVLKDVSFAFLETADLSFVLDSDKTVENTHAFFGNFNYRNPKVFDIQVGLRVNYFQGLDAVRLEPRIFLYKDIFRNLKLQISGEIKNQIISEIDETVLSDLSLENKLWRLADGETFPIINSKQLSLGFVYNRNGWSFDTDYYYKKINGITALSLGFLNQSDSQFHTGDQKVLGADFYLKKDFDFLSTWFSYSINKVENRYEGLNNDEYFASSNNIRHALTASIAYKLKTFQVAVGWNWRTGKPFTEALMSSADGSLFFQKINTSRLPRYHRLDISSTYGFRFSEKNKLKGKIGFAIRNVYDQKNHLSREYSGNNNLNDPVTAVDKFSLGFTPNFLLRVYW